MIRFIFAAIFTVLLFAGPLNAQDHELPDVMHVDIRGIDSGTMEDGLLQGQPEYLLVLSIDLDRKYKFHPNERFQTCKIGGTPTNSFKELEKTCVIEREDVENAIESVLHDFRRRERRSDGRLWDATLDDVWHNLRLTILFYEDDFPRDTILARYDLPLRYLEPGFSRVFTIEDDGRTLKGRKPWEATQCSILAKIHVPEE